MKPIVSFFGLPIGISAAFWGIIGFLRFLTEKVFKKSPQFQAAANKYTRKDIAVILPAHNEELMIRSCIQALKQSLDPKQIYVVSDGSIDRTYRRAKMEGCHVSYLIPGRGKAKAMIYLLQRFRLFKKYRLIFIVDADTNIDEHLVERALPHFNDPQIAVVFASARIHWPQHFIPKLRWYFVAYRERLNRILTYFYIYGQTWKYTNTNYVIPGFCTIYRSEILRQLQIDTPGILVEDFNLAFQLYRKKLGKMAYDPTLIGWDQYPTNLKDYWKQVRRWNIGFFQTIKKNGIWPSWFWLSLGIFSVEVIANSIFLVFLPLLVLFWITLMLPSFSLLDNLTIFFQKYLPFRNVTASTVFFSLFVFDYLVSVIIGLTHKRPQFIFYGLFFFILHYITSLILITSFIPGFFSASEGKWISPVRNKA